MAKLEDEKMSLLEAEKFFHENPPTSVTEVQNAIQLKKEDLWSKRYLGF